MPWLGQIAWGDHDMFHSSDKAAGRMMAVSKAISGGPVYLSDRYAQLVSENILPLCYSDGYLLRPLAPASPLPEDLFRSMDEPRLYRAMAPLRNKTAVFEIYNFQADPQSEPVELTTTITPADYQSVSGMIQPYPGKWDLPSEGLVVYDYYKRTAAKFNQSYDVAIKGFGDCLLQVSPVLYGWSVIGRVDKYLPAAAVDVVSCNDQQLTLHFREAGPFSVWLDAGKPKVDGLEFVDKGNGLYEAVMEVKSAPVTVMIEKQCAE
jgi:hypothetical protein